MDRRDISLISKPSVFSVLIQYPVPSTATGRSKTAFLQSFLKRASCSTAVDRLGPPLRGNMAAISVAEVIKANVLGE